MVGDTIYAYTQTGMSSFPGYVNLRDVDGLAELTLRTPGHNGMKSASLPMPDARLRELQAAIGEYLAKKDAEDFVLPAVDPARDQGTSICEACQ